MAAASNRTEPVRAYVESNFVLELALEQDEAESCRDILSLCEAGRLDLVIPAFGAKPFYALARSAPYRTANRADR